MKNIMPFIKKIINPIIIFFSQPLVYLFISYVLLFTTFIIEINDAYKHNSLINSYQHCDFFVTPACLND